MHTTFIKIKENILTIISLSVIKNNIKIKNTC